MRLKLLSIAIPTLNRADILKFTIENFIDQIAINSEKVELVVCSNACNDNTSDVMKEFVSQYDFIQYKECDNRVSLGDSFKRTVDFSKGKYFILWGDDDIPAPFLVSYLIHRIESNPDIELYYFNRLVGYEDGCSIKGLTLYENRYDSICKRYTYSTQFITDNFWGATFMSAMLCSRDVWTRGLSLIQVRITGSSLWESFIMVIRVRI